MTPNPIALAEAYAPDRRGRIFGFFDRLYAWPHTHRGADYRAQNAAKTASIVTHVVAIEGGEVVYAGRAPMFNGKAGGKIGGVIAIKTSRKAGTGVYEIHSHTIPAVKVGDIVAPGQKIGRNAGWMDAASWQGTSWRGCHDHIVFSDSYDGAWSTIRRVFDPEPIIRAALRRHPVPTPTPTPAGGQTAPVPPLEKEEVDDMGIRILGTPRNGTEHKPFHRYIVIPGVGSVHISNTDHLELLRRYLESGVRDDEETFRPEEVEIITSYLGGKAPTAPAR